MFDKRNDNKQGASRGSTQQDSPSAASPGSPAIGKSALIGAGISINGDITGNENLLIEGRVEGKINLPGHRVEVGAAGKVKADIQAKYIRVEGELSGDIDGKEKVVIAKSGNVRGNITAPRVMLEDGAVFKGSIDIDPNDTAPVELPLTAQKVKDNVKPLGADASKKDSGYTAKGG